LIKYTLKEKENQGNKNMNKIISSIRKDLKANVDKDYRIGSKRFFKEKIICYGVRTPVVRKIAKKYSREIKSLNKKEIFEITETLFRSGYNEEATIATQWLIESMDKITDKDFPILERWIDKYLDNWSKIDDYCTHLISSMLIKYPGLMKNLKNWSASDNLWVRRASAVSLITTNKEFYEKNKNMDFIFWIAKRPQPFVGNLLGLAKASQAAKASETHPIIPR
jgi:3-methyladenine DNA glycosylase AlkD